MAKGSRRRIFRLGKHNEGCLWGLFSLFDFHLARNSPRLLSNREHGSGRIAVADGYLSDAHDLRTDFAEKDADSSLRCQDEVHNGVLLGDSRIMVDDETFNNGQAECSSFINEKQMISSSQLRNNISQNESAGAVPHLTPCDVTDPTQHVSYLTEQYCGGLELTTLSQRSEDERKKEHGAEYWKNSHFKASIHTQSKLDQPDARAILSRRFLQDFCDKLFHMEHMAPQEALNHYEELINALEVIISNKELLSELLQKPDAKLIEYVQKLQDIHEDEVPIAIETTSLQEQDADNILAKGRGLEIQRTKGTLKKIVVLKPVPSRMEGLSIPSSSISSRLSSPDATAYMGKRRSIFLLSFQEIKRRLMHAIVERKKERKFMHTDTKESFHRFHLGCQKIRDGVQAHWPTFNSCTIRTDDGAENQLQEKPKGHHGNNNLRVNSNRSQDKQTICALEREYNFQREAKKHLIEMLHSKHKHEQLPEKRDSIALWNMLSLQDYKFSSGYNADGFNNSALSPPQMRFPPIWSPNLLENPERFSLVKHKPEGTDFHHANEDIEPCMLDLNSTLFITDLEDEDHIKEVACQKGPVKVVDDDNSCKTEFSGEALFPDEISDNGHKVAELDKMPACDESRSPLSDSAMETKSSSPPNSPSILRIHSTEAHEVIMEKLERPSPVSVLMPPFVDDATSSSSPISEQREDVGLSVSPRELFLDEYDKQEECLITSCSESISQELMGEEGFRLEYIVSVLEASGLMHVETWVRRKPPHALLDSSVFDEVEPPCSVSQCDLMLLFDCTSEVIEGIREKYFPRNLWATFVKPNVRPFPCHESLLNEVYGKTACQHATHSCSSLNQVIQKDLDMIVWLDTSNEIDELGFAIEDDILEEVLEDLVFDIFD